MHVNRHADFPLQLRIKLPGQEDPPKDPEPPVTDDNPGDKKTEDISGLEIEIFDTLADWKQKMPGYSNSRYNYPCSIFSLKHTETDAPRVRAWFSGDYSGVTSLLPQISQPTYQRLSTTFSRISARPRAGLVSQHPHSGSGRR